MLNLSAAIVDVAFVPAVAETIVEPATVIKRLALAVVRKVSVTEFATPATPLIDRFACVPFEIPSAISPYKLAILIVAVAVVPAPEVTMML
jgi:hypothetical protein